MGDTWYFDRMRRLIEASGACAPPCTRRPRSTVGPSAAYAAAIVLPNSSLIARERVRQPVVPRRYKVASEDLERSMERP